jgi:DNA primase
VPTWKGLIRFESVLEADLRVLSLPRGKDPDEVVLEDPAEWQRLVAQALPVVDFYFNAVTARLDLRNPRDKATAADRLLPIIGEIVDDVVRSHYLQKLSTLVQVDERTLANRLRSAHQPPPRKSAQPEPAAPARATRQTFDDYCLAILLSEPELYWKAMEHELSPDDFPGAENHHIFIAFQVAMQSGDAFDLAIFRQSLDLSLHPHLDELMHLGAKKPMAIGDDMSDSLIVTILRGRKQRLNSEIAQMTYLLREAKQEGNQAETANLTNHVHALSAELGELGRKLDERTVLWRTRGDT